VSNVIPFAPRRAENPEAGFLGIRRVLELAGYIDNRYLSEDALARGRLLDQVTQGIDSHDPGEVAEALDRADDDSIRHACEQYATFLGECKPVYSGIEVATKHDALRIRGRIDRKCSALFGAPAIIDIKGGSVEKWHRLQVALYWICEGCNPHERRYCLYLPSRGRYKLVEHRDTLDIHEAMDAIDRARRQLARMA
jgi:hypothetical protein